MKKTALFTILSSFVVFSFASCSGVIFDDIRKEVKLEDADISGDVRSIVKFKDALYVQNGRIWKKSNLESKHGWSKCPSPSVSADYIYVNKLAADGSNLYAQVSLINKDKDESENVSAGVQIYASADGTSWNGPIEIDGKTTFTAGSAILFSESEFNAAYVSYDNKIYTLNGNSDPSGTEGSAKSCAGTVFYSGNAIVKKGSTYYRSNGKSVEYSTDGSSWTAANIDAPGSIYSIACTKDYLILGTSQGIAHAKIGSDGVPETVSNFSNNAESALSSSYQVWCVYADDSSLNESGTIIYGTTTYEGSSGSSSATQDKCGLWAQYPGSNWNRE